LLARSMNAAIVEIAGARPDLPVVAKFRAAPRRQTSART
jgi:hypothetical protein